MTQEEKCEFKDNIQNLLKKAEKAGKSLKDAIADLTL